MTTVDKIIDFAEQIAKEDALKMQQIQAWEDFITPLFKKKFGYEYRLGYESMYSKECQAWLDEKRTEFKVIEEVLKSIKDQTGIELALCDYFTGMNTCPNGDYFNVVLTKQIFDSMDYVRLSVFAEKYKTIRVEPNGVRRVAIFPLS